MDSILNTIKKMLGPDNDDPHFDVDIIVHINSALSRLSQLGVGPPNGFSITGDSETWDQFIGSDKRMLAVKTYIYLRVRLVFDPPTIASVLQAWNDEIKETEWRLNVDAESKE